MKYSSIGAALGLILIGFSSIVFLPVLVALIYGDYFSVIPFATASVFGVVLGLLCRLPGRRERNSLDSLKRTEGLLIVLLAWVVTSLIGAIPYLFYNISPLDACFEAVSGITTTGATILQDFSLYPHAFFFWRSLTQWLGGMGIVVLVVAVLPQLSVAGRQIFFAEAPGPTEEKLTPRIANTAKALWLVYTALTLIQCIMLYFFGMPLFDAICNSLSTMAAGGFSPNPQSIMGYENPTFTWVITFFMFLAGSNYALQYSFFIKRKPLALFSSGEFRLYTALILTVSALLTVSLVSLQNLGIVDGVREAFFQVISLITTTGFASSDFGLWCIPAQAILLTTMYAGGCAGSAGGGIKIVRILFMAKYLRREIVRILHPHAVVTVKIDQQTVSEDVQSQMLGFLLFYLLLMAFSGLAITIIEGNASVGFIGTAATIGNIGPGLGEIGPMGSFGGLSPLTKLIMLFNMIAGRLELIPVLVLFNKDFWN